MTDRITIKRYSTPEEVLSALFGGVGFDEIASFGGVDVDGTEYELPISDALKNIKETGCYGFTDSKKIIHVWVDQNVAMANLINLIAHERGHIQRPHFRDEMKEEMKAGGYGDCAEFAYCVAKDLIVEDKAEYVYQKQGELP